MAERQAMQAMESEHEAAVQKMLAEVQVSILLDSTITDSARGSSL